MAEILSKISATFKRRKGILAAIVLLACAGVAAFFLWGRKAAAGDYMTAKVERGNVEVNVSATGTVQAVTTVQVGSQVSGTVQWLGADFNSQVKKGQVIARLDPAIFQAQVDNARASVKIVTDAECKLELLVHVPRGETFPRRQTSPTSRLTSKPRRRTSKSTACSATTPPIWSGAISRSRT